MTGIVFLHYACETDHFHNFGFQTFNSIHAIRIKQEVYIMEFTGCLRREFVNFLNKSQNTKLQTPPKRPSETTMTHQASSYLLIQ